MNKLRVIITGATGMVGEGVLYKCLENTSVEKVLVIGRKTCGYSNPKLTEIIHSDFFDFSSIKEELKGYNACYFCLGTTAMGKTEAEYTKFTHTLTLHFATLLANLNPDMTFCYISGSGTDSSEKGRIMWARVKGKTENDLMKLPFTAVFNFRPGAITPLLPLKPTQTYYKTYKYLAWLFAIMKVLTPAKLITLEALATAMINVSLSSYPQHNIEIKDMKVLANINNKI
jgi:uncharacterized protein YbjT (DUF2867 family)